MASMDGLGEVMEDDLLAMMVDDGEEQNGGSKQ